MRNPRTFVHGREKAIALVVTLLILVLLTVMAVALLQSSGIDRTSSKAVADKAKADLAAQTAANAAIAQLVDNITTFPDAATSWETINGNDVAVLYYRDQTPEQAISTNTQAQLYVLPLASGGIAQKFANKANALPPLTDTPLTTANAYNLNHPRTAGDTVGWIGSSPQWLSSSPTTPQAFRGQWVNLTDSSAKITGRYAFWMEDESFKANANFMGDTPRGSNTLGNLPSQVPFQGILKAVLGSGSAYDSIAASITNYRGQFPGSLFFNYRDLNQVAGQSTLADAAKFEATLFSGALNLSRNGSRRINLDKVVMNSTDPIEIRKELDEIIKTITVLLPNFSQRFYRNGADKNSMDVVDTSAAGSPSHRTIYLNKIAANIRDYIDTDSQPTIVNNDSGLSVNIGAVPTHSLPGGGANGPNEVVAIGKEAVPFIQEYVLRVKQDTFSNRLGASASYKLEIDHYIEVWNMTSKDVVLTDLGSKPFLRIANQFAWDSGGGNDIPESPSRDFSIPLSSFNNSSGKQLYFAAGGATVITTDPNPLPSTFPGVDVSHVFRPPAGTPPDASRIYQGTTKKKSSSNLRINSVPRPNNISSAADLETELVLGNDNGVLESFGGPAAYYVTANVDDGNSNADSKHADATNYYFRASSLKGNTLSATTSQTGDPRTNNEQISVTTSVANDDQTPHKLEITNLAGPFSNTTLSSLNTNYVDEGLWTDFAANAATPNQAPMVIANAALTSIAELGNVFDPARTVGISGSILYSRGGGRTLRIGQPDDLWDGNSTSASREWTSWRLADVFTTNDYISLDGRININGVNRDGGAAFRAALYGYSFQVAPDSDPTIASQPLTDPQIDALISQMKLRLTNQAPFAQTTGSFAEFGELSEMPVFNSGTQLTGKNMAAIYDRGREEIFRRLTELITTRGNIFTVYAVGQSLAPQSAGTPVVTSTAQLKIIFRIDPVGATFVSANPADPFDPTSIARFKKPDKYAIKILYAGD